MTARTDSGVRPVPRRTTRGAVLVVTSDRRPEWVERWCRSADRVADTVLVPAPEPLASAVPELAARAARDGSAVLLVHESPTDRPDELVVVAVRSLPEDGPVVEEAARCAVAIGARLQVVHAVPMAFAAKSVGLTGAVDRGRATLALALRCARRAVPGADVDVRLLRMRPHEVVGEHLDADLLVLGGLRPGPDGALGLVALSALHHAPCSVLLVPCGTRRSSPITRNSRQERR
jgi:nucleotide-binding universal stress UspA family protein